ncbi:MAG: DUF72 domain-containing protein [Gemmatimonadaceae bacterium]|nr:DUF72 domain-containing protein [Gemmatimonadaceae bacterium]
MAASIRLGTQGWNYDAWLGSFYPSGTKAPDYLGVYSRAFESVEIDSTFYAIPAVRSVRGWAARVPDGFKFALKLPQEITHDNRLRESADLTALFLDRARELDDKLGIVLIQLGPDFAPSELPALVSFLPTLPTKEIPFAIEFRQRGWINDGVLALLREYNVALTLTDARWIPRKQMLALAENPTSDTAYLRWMGPNRDFTDYSHIQVDRTRELHAWANAITGLTERVKTIYGFVNNHFSGHSPESVRQLQRLLGQTPVTPDQLGEQMTLF